MTTSHQIFDRELVLNNFGGDIELLRALARLFIADWPQSRSHLLTALEGSDAEGLRAAAHSLKGAVANFCAPRAVTSAKTLELACKAGDLSQAPAQVATLLAAVEQVVAALAAEGG